MILFDEIVRSEMGPATESEPDYLFLNRSARPEVTKIRQMVEDWFAHYPDSEKADLYARFRSEVDAQHRAACFELALHALFRPLGYEIALHPGLSTTQKTPDFLLSLSAEDRFYLEATIAVGVANQEAAAQARMNTVYDVLNRRVDSPNFFLWLEIRGAPSTQPPAKKLASFIRANLEDLDPDMVTELYESDNEGAIPTWYVEHEGWTITFRPIPKKPEARGKPRVRPIGMRTYGFKWANHWMTLRDSIVDKAGRYGQLGLPYIIAMNALDPVDQDDILDALFGQEQYTLTFSETDRSQPTNAQMSRKPNGVWTSPAGPRYTRVSGVLVATRFSIWDIAQASVRLYHNPWAEKPYSSHLARLSQAIPKGNHLTSFEGGSLASILGLV